MEHPTCYKDNPKNKQNSTLPMSNKSVNLMQNQSWNLKSKHAQHRTTKPCQTGTKQELIPTQTRMQSPLWSTGTGWQLQNTKFIKTQNPNAITQGFTGNVLTTPKYRIQTTKMLEQIWNHQINHKDWKTRSRTNQ